MTNEELKELKGLIEQLRVNVAHINAVVIKLEKEIDAINRSLQAMTEAHQLY